MEHTMMYDPANNDENKLRDAWIKYEDLTCDPLEEGTIACALEDLAHLQKERILDLEAILRVRDSFAQKNLKRIEELERTLNIENS